VQKKYGKLPVQAGHMYVKPGVEELKLVNIEEDNIQSVVDNIKKAVADIMAEDFEVKSKPNCYFCDFKGICEWRNEN
jgi:DNA helicase-2/ATP-dependent DNA helicase PcrA